MLINLCGPPAAGKSTAANRLVLKLSAQDSFRQKPVVWASIDTFRHIHKEEEDAWYELMKFCIRETQRATVVIESSGLSWRLKAHILEHPIISKHGISTIILTADREILKERLTNRKKTPVPFKYKALTEESLIDYSLEQLPQVYPKAKTVDTGHQTVEETEEELEQVIFVLRMLR